MKTEDRYKNLERVNYWVANADTKVSYLLAIQGIILTLVFTSSINIAILKTIGYRFDFTNITWASSMRFIEGISLYCFLIFVILSFVNIYKTLKAQIDSSVFQELDLKTNSLLFFETIANRKFKDFESEQISLSDQELDSHIDSQVFINSKICQKKFKHYNLSLRYCCISLIPAIVYVILRIKYGS
ncbi:hypothetical protein [Flammeovirga aprica]|uniref:Pycsar effector protein domain-containing protein n=1 Tax=Flammeovirga aprica JL-4 TaxID=694437 RepID=A0A7X9RQ80_9BACT|nr:hypothetical protein [Flammeovirga aprica]NME66498.1 hypothetical protein [Flammeovirga aprica JL-4]